MLRVGYRRAQPLVGSAQAHPGYLPPDALATDAVALVAQVPRHLTAAVEQSLQGNARSFRDHAAHDPAGQGISFITDRFSGLSTLPGPYDADRLIPTAHSAG